MPTDVNSLPIVFLMIAALSILLERSLAVIFESSVYQRILGKLMSLKEGLAIASAYGICYYYQFDGYATLLTKTDVSRMGYLLTALVIAGGAKGSMKLFQGYLGIVRPTGNP